MHNNRTKTTEYNLKTIYRSNQKIQ